ncbi:hypothetical protein PAMP_011317 [Pampus punctatissimus]
MRIDSICSGPLPALAHRSEEQSELCLKGDDTHRNVNGAEYFRGGIITWQEEDGQESEAFHEALDRHPAMAVIQAQAASTSLGQPPLNPPPPFPPPHPRVLLPLTPPPQFLPPLIRDQWFPGP